MINIPLDKLLFIDIETVGIESNWETLRKNRPELSSIFINYLDWFQKRFPEDSTLSIDSIFYNRSALVPEFAKIACVSVAFVTDKGETKMQSFSNENEKDLLQEVQKLLRRVGELGFFL